MRNSVNADLTEVEDTPFDAKVLQGHEPSAAGPPTVLSARGETAPSSPRQGSSIDDVALLRFLCVNVGSSQTSTISEVWRSFYPVWLQLGL